MLASPLDAFPLRVPLELKPKFVVARKKLPKHWLSLESNDPNFGVPERRDDVSNFRRQWRRIACSNLLSVTDPNFCLSIADPEQSYAASKTSKQGSHGMNELIRVAKEESEMLQLECHWISKTNRLDICPRVPTLMNILSSRQRLAKKLKRACQSFCKVSEFVYHKEREIRYANCPANSLPRAARCANSLNHASTGSLLSQGVILNSSRIKASPLCIKTFSYISATRTRQLVLEGEEGMIMALEDRLSLAAGCYFNAKTSYDDNNTYVMLAIRYGPMDERDFSFDAQPGNRYHIRLNKMAHIIQRFWKSCWPYLVIIRGCAVVRIQKYYRRYYVYKKWHPIIKIRLKVGRTSYLKLAMKGWKQYVKVIKICKKFLRSNDDNLMHAVVKGWRIEVIAIKKQREIVARKFLARLMNPLMTKCFVAWQTYRITSLKIKRLFRRQLLKPCMDMWKANHYQRRNFFKTVTCCVAIQSLYRGHAVRMATKKHLKKVVLCQKLIRGYLFRCKKPHIKASKEKVILNRFVNFNNHVSLSDLAEKEKSRLTRKRKAINGLEGKILTQLRNHLSTYNGKVQVAYEVMLMRGLQQNANSSESIKPQSGSGSGSFVTNAFSFAKKRLTSVFTNNDTPVPKIQKGQVSGRADAVRKKDVLGIAKYAENSISEYSSEEKSKTVQGFSVYGKPSEGMSILVHPSSELSVNVVSVVPHETLVVNKLIERASLIAREIGNHDFEAKHCSRFSCPVPSCEAILLTCEQFKSHINSVHVQVKLQLEVQRIVELHGPMAIGELDEVKNVSNKGASQVPLSNFSDFYSMLEEVRVVSALTRRLENVMPSSRILNTLKLWLAICQLQKIPYISPNNEDQLVEYSNAATEIYSTYLGVGSDLTFALPQSVRDVDKFMTLFKHREFDGFFKHMTIDAQNLGVAKEGIFSISKMEKAEFWTEEFIVPTGLFDQVKWECVLLIWRYCHELVGGLEDTINVMSDVNAMKEKKGLLLAGRCADHFKAENKVHAKDLHLKLKNIASLAESVVDVTFGRIVDEIWESISSKQVYEALVTRVQMLDSPIEIALAASDDIVEWALDDFVDDIFQQAIFQASKDKFVRLMITGRVEKSAGKKELSARKIQTIYRGFAARRDVRKKVALRYRKRFERAINKMVYVDGTTGKEYLRRPAIIGIMFRQCAF